MPDSFTKRKRSDVMSRIRGTGNKDTELRLIQIFRANGIISLRLGYGPTGGLATGLQTSGQTGLCFSQAEDRGVCGRLLQPSPGLRLTSLARPAFAHSFGEASCPRHAISLRQAYGRQA